MPRAMSPAKIASTCSRVWFHPNSTQMSSSKYVGEYTVKNSNYTGSKMRNKKLLNHLKSIFNFVKKGISFPYHFYHFFTLYYCKHPWIAIDGHFLSAGHEIASFRFKVSHLMRISHLGTRATNASRHRTFMNGMQIPILAIKLSYLQNKEKS